MIGSEVVPTRSGHHEAFPHFQILLLLLREMSQNRIIDADLGTFPKCLGSVQFQVPFYRAM